MESDWKHFRAQVPVWRERYLAGRNAEAARRLMDGARTPTERFWEVEEQMRKDVRCLRDCFDGHSRSRMREHLLRMLGRGVITAMDLDKFSPELRESCLGVMG